MTDTELLRALRRADTEAMAAIIDRYSAYVAAVVHRALGALSRPEDVEEIASDVFYALWQSRGRLRSEDSLRPWLAAVARNRARNHLRSLGEIPAEEDALAGLSTLSAESLATERERCRVIAQAIEEMGEPDSEIFLRRYYCGESVAEIAAATRLHPENVKTRLRRGREKLKKLLKKGGCEL